MKIRNYLATIVLIPTALFFAYDIVAYLLDEDGNRFHIALEAVVFLVVSLMLARELSRVRQLNKTASEQQSRMARLSGDLRYAVKKGYRSLDVTLPEDFSLIKKLKESHTVTRICNVFEVNRSSYKYWLKRARSFSA